MHYAAAPFATTHFAQAGAEAPALVYDHVAPLRILPLELPRYDHVATLSFLQTVSVDHIATLPIYRVESLDHIASLPIYRIESVDHVAPLPIYHSESVDHIALLPIYRIESVDHVALLPIVPTPLPNYDHIATLTIFATASPRDDTTDTVVTIVATGHVLDTGTVEIAQGDTDIYWTAAIELRNPADYYRLRNQDLIDIQIGAGPTWRLMIETRDYDQPALGLATASLRAISPSASHDSPRSQTRSWLWDHPQMAAAIAAEIIPQLSIQWDRVNWLVRAYRLALEDATPMAALSHLVTKTGGRLHTQPGGQTLRIEDRHKVAVPAMATTTPDLELTDRDDLFVAAETDTYSVGINRVRVYDQAPAQNDQVETEVDGLEAEIRVYPQPWRTRITLRTTRGDLVTTLAQGTETRTIEDEEVEVVEGAGATSYPIQTLISAIYLSDNLGAIVTSPYSREITTAAPNYSLLRLTYTTRALLFHATAADAGTAQMVVEGP